MRHFEALNTAGYVRIFRRSKFQLNSSAETRTRDLYEDFVQVLVEVDVLLVLDVYSAGEEPIPGAGSKNLCGSIRQRGGIDPIYVESIEEVPYLLGELVRGDDIVLTQGAGSVSKLVAMLTETELGRVLGPDNKSEVKNDYL